MRYAISVVAAVLAPALVACGADEHVEPVDASPTSDSWPVEDGCGSEFPCPPPDAGKATLCGRLWDVETDLPIDVAARDPFMLCDPMSPSPDGPCSLAVRFFDALDFGMNPMGAQPLVPEGGVTQDGCNRYRGHNLPRATFGTIAVVVDDADGVADRHRLTAVAVANDVASPISHLRAYTTRATTDVAWSTPVFGGAATFAARGVVVLTFTHQAVPRAGVQARREGVLVADDDYYFTDSGISRSLLSTTTSSTGTNGSALVIGSSGLMLHDGVGGEPSGCRWPSVRAVAAPGVVAVQLAEAETPAGGPCP